MHGSSPPQKCLTRHGPVAGCQHIFDQLIALDAKFSGVLFRNFIVACTIASAEGQA
jgi:hypothetical protein